MVGGTTVPDPGAKPLATPVLLGLGLDPLDEAVGLGVEAGVLGWADGEAVADGRALRGMTDPRASADVVPVEPAAEGLFVGLVVGPVTVVVSGLLSAPVGDGTGIILMTGGRASEATSS